MRDKPKLALILLLVASISGCSAGAMKSVLDVAEVLGTSGSDSFEPSPAWENYTPPPVPPGACGPSLWCSQVEQSVPDGSALSKRGH